MKSLVFVISIFLGVVPVVYGHEGHKMPGTLSAQHGGQVKNTKNHAIEVTFESGIIKLYTYSDEMKKIAPDSVKLSAIVKKMPKPGTTTTIDLKAKDEFYEGNIDSKGARRLEVIVEISSEKNKEKLTFNIEI